MIKQTDKSIAAKIFKVIRRVVLIVLIVILLLLLVGGIILHNKIKSVLSIKKVSDGLYSMEYAGDLKTDELLKTDIHSIPEMIEWVRKEEFYNLPFSIDEDNIGCAAFATKTPEGNVLMGRNFDFNETDTLMVHVKPKDGYESYALADLKVLGVGRNGGLISPDYVIGKAIMLVAPYGVCDGINEAGLGTAILELEIGETHMNTDKHDICMYNVIRVLLDKCATVDEALELLGNQDIHTGLGASYHLFIEDKTGRSVVVEWLDDKMCVNELNAATNSVLTKGVHYNDGSPDGRYGILQDKLEKSGGILTKEDAKNLLKDVLQDNTEWSCVYDLTDFSFDVYMDTNYEKAIHFPR